MKELLHVNNENFEEEVLKNKGVTLVDFFATWCGPCKMLSPIIEQVNEEGAFKVVKLDVDEALDIARKYGIMSVPTLVLFVNGEEKERMIGLRQKAQILEAAKKYL